jgi:hypothetical protein
MQIDINLKISFSDDAKTFLQKCLATPGLEKKVGKDSPTTSPVEKKPAISRDDFVNWLVAFRDKDGDEFMKDERKDQIKDAIKKVTGEVMPVPKITPDNYTRILDILEKL